MIHFPLIYTLRFIIAMSTLVFINPRASKILPLWKYFTWNKHIGKNYTMLIPRYTKIKHHKLLEDFNWRKIFRITFQTKLEGSNAKKIVIKDQIQAKLNESINLQNKNRDRLWKRDFRSHSYFIQVKPLDFSNFVKALVSFLKIQSYYLKTIWK